MPAPLPPENRLACLADGVVFDEDSSSAHSDSIGSEYEPEEYLKPIIFSWKQLSDLIRDLALSKQKSRTSCIAVAKKQPTSKGCVG